MSLSAAEVHTLRVIADALSDLFHPEYADFLRGLVERHALGPHEISPLGVLALRDELEREDDDDDDDEEYNPPRWAGLYCFGCGGVGHTLEMHIAAPELYDCC